MEPSIKLPNFELTKEIGRGGMSRVYLGRQLEPKRDVAIKIVSPGSAPDPAFLSSLKQEGDTVASMSHDNIVTVYACGVVDNHYFMAMEILSGGDLTEKIKKGMRPEEAVEVMIQIGSALEHAHRKNVLHRDIKPENVMFHESGKAVLVDFGIAKEGNAESSFTQVGAVVGTPHYMSPERCMGKPIDARSDLYAMGVMFYEMLTGHKVFEGRDTFAVSYAHVYEPVPPLPPEHARFQPIINKLLAKDPKDRYQTAGEMVAALKKHRAGAPAAAEPATRRMGTAVVTPLQDKLNRLGGGETVVSSPTQGSTSTSAATAIAKPVPAPAARGDAATVVSAATPAPATPEAPVAPARSGPPIAVLAGIAALGVVAGLAFVLWPKPAPVDEMPRAILSQEQIVEMTDSLAAASSMLRTGKAEDAAGLYEKVLREFDCNNEEARRGLRAADPGNDERYRKAIAKCQ
jgi:serine/threonine-protein kinase PpkA